MITYDIRFAGERHELTRDEKLALEAWVRCDVVCERFDRELPGAWSPHDRDVWLPLPDFRWRSVAHANRQQLIAEAACEGIDRAIVERMRAVATRLLYDEQVELIAYLEANRQHRV